MTIDGESSRVNRRMTSAGQQAVHEGSAAENDPMQAALLTNPAADRRDHFHNRPVETPRDPRPVGLACEVVNNRPDDRTRINDEHRLLVVRACLFGNLYEVAAPGGGLFRQPFQFDGRLAFVA